MSNDLLFKVVERYLYHVDMSNSEDELISSTAKTMCEIEIAEMWMLTQN